MQDSDWVASIRAFFEAMQALGPTAKGLAAVLTVGAGFVLAVIGRRIAKRLLRRSALALSSAVRSPTGAQSRRLESLVGETAYWGILITALLMATEIVGIPIVRGWLSQVAGYLPRLLGAILIVAAGTLLSRAGREMTMRAATSAGLAGVARVGRATEVAILSTAALIAVEQLGLEISFIKAVLLIFLGAVLFGAALAFGLGGRDLVSNVLAAHYLQRAYSVGQTIRAGEAQGRIVRMTEIAVVIETDDGELSIPAAELTRDRSELLLRGGAR